NLSTREWRSGDAVAIVPDANHPWLHVSSPANLVHERVDVRLWGLRDVFRRDHHVRNPDHADLQHPDELHHPHAHRARQAGEGLLRGRELLNSPEPVPLIGVTILPRWRYVPSIASEDGRARAIPAHPS